VSTEVTDVFGNQLDQNPRHRGLQPKEWSFTVLR